MKKKIISIFLTGVLTCNLFGCGKSVSDVSNSTETNESKEQIQSEEFNQEMAENGGQSQQNIKKDSQEKMTESLEEAYADFAFDLLKASQKKGENMMISPLSVMAALSMAAEGALGNTKSQMDQVMYGSLSEEKAVDELLSYLNGLPSTEETRLEIANSIWLKQDGETVFLDAYLEKMAVQFDSCIYESDFGQETLAKINSWVDEKTYGKIDKILNDIDKDAIMYIINAISFDGTWENEYEDIDIEESEIFTKEDGSTEEVTMLYSTEYGYLEDENTTGFVKEYKNGYSFVALLPKEGVTLQDYMASLDGDKWNELMTHMDNEPKVYTKIPEFSAGFEIEMSDVLKNLGMADAFDKENADFSGMIDYSALNPGENIYINRVIHKTYINLDRKGTEAAAVTAIEFAKVTSCAPIEKEIEIKEVYLDRPFIYAIIDNDSQLPIFVGIVDHIN